MSSDADASGADRPGAHASADWRVELSAGRFGSAHRAFLLSGGRDPELQAALAGLSDVQALVRQKGWRRAVRRLGQIEARPAVVPWSQLEADLDRLQRAGEALDRRRPEEAVAELDAIESDVFLAEAETQRGTALIYDDRTEEAAACFQRALEADPRHYRALTNLGNVALEQGRVDDAIAAYQRALELNDAFANAHHNLAVAYRRKGELGRSVRSLRRAQRLMQRRDADDARDRLGSLSAGRGGRLLRWVLTIAAVLLLYVLLKSRGVF